MNTTLAVLATIPAIIAIVNFLKTFGVTGKWAILAAVVLGGGLSVTDLLYANNAIYAAASNGVLLGLAAAGIYDITNTKGKGTVTINNSAVAPSETATQVRRAASKK